jgi:hypothetical protein
MDVSGTSIGIRARVPLWQPWAAIGGFALLLHFVWEMLQAPFFVGMADAPHWSAVLRCSQASAGDVVITWLAYACAAWWAGGRSWLAELPTPAVLVYVATGLGITVLLEWVNVYVRSTWAYADEMPTVLGIGVTPLLQWLILPPLTLWLARRHLGLSKGCSWPASR